jgi:hypothetical protein
MSIIKKGLGVAYDLSVEFTIVIISCLVFA